MIFLKGDVILIPYPFSDLSSIKVRPGLVVSNDKYNKVSRDLVCVPLTSVLKKEKYSVLLNPEDMIKGKLIKKSKVKCGKVFCVDKKVVRMKIGRVNQEVFLKIKKVLDDIL